MTNTKEALLKARAALVSCTYADSEYWFNADKVDDAIATIDAALSQQEEGELPPKDERTWQSDRGVEEIMATLRNAPDESTLSFSAKEMRGVLNLWKSERTMRETWQARANMLVKEQEPDIYGFRYKDGLIVDVSYKEKEEAEESWRSMIDDGYGQVVGLYAAPSHPVDTPACEEAEGICKSCDNGECTAKSNCVALDNPLTCPNCDGAPTRGELVCDLCEGDGEVQAVKEATPCEGDVLCPCEGCCEAWKTHPTASKPNTGDMVDTVDDDHPLWRINEQIKELLEGVGASEDHEDVLTFLRTTGLPEGTVARIHKALVRLPSTGSQPVGSPEKVDLLGIRADGSSEVIGQVPIPPKMKMRDIVRNFIGEPSDDPDACDDATVCMWALEAYHEWLLEQGWKAPQVTITPKV